MKSLKQHIKEAYWDNNSPDEIKFKNKNGEITSLDWCSKNAYAFIYSTKLNKFLISDKGDNHCSILYTKYNDNELKEFDDLYDVANNKDGIYSLRFVDDFFGDINYDDWKNQNKDINNRFKLGRYWLYEGVLYMTWWDSLTPSEFDKYNKELLKFVTKEVENNGDEKEQFDEVYYMVNDGRFIKYDPNKKSEDIKSSDERKKIIQLQQAIHLANQKEKKEFFKEFKRRRNANKQKIYNHTKSKTEAEWRSIRYQDSLIDREKNKIID